MKDNSNGCVGCLMLIICAGTLIGVLLYVMYLVGGG